MNAVLLFSLATALAMAVPIHADAAPEGKKLMLYVGTYTRDPSQGIHVLQMDTQTGALTSVGVVTGQSNPSFLAIHPNRRFLYAVNETGDFGAEKTGAVSAYAVDAKTGMLTPLNRESSRGTYPCHISLDRQGRHALVANYGSGSVAVLPIGPDGRLGPATAFVQHEGSSVNKQRQEGPHGHSINLDAGNRFAVAADLGLDRLLVYRYDAGKGALAPNDPPFAAVAPGAGPRHFAFHPDGRRAYVINELNSTLTAFDYDAKQGVLTERQTVPTLPAGFTGTNYPAEVVVHPSGRFVYGSNRGHDSIAVFRVESDGALTPAGHVPTGGKEPRNFVIDPTGNYLVAANQNSNRLVVFRINRETGQLTPTGHTVEIPMPVCVRFMPPAR